MDIDWSQLRPVGLSDRAFFQERQAIRDRRSCEEAFANLVLWQRPYDEQFIVVRDRAVILERETGVLHFPIGEWMPPEELAELWRSAEAAGLAVRTLYDVPEAYPEEFPETAGRFRIAAEEAAFDYLYDTARLAESAGPLLRKKRNLIHQFDRLHPDARVERITAANAADAVALARELNRKLAHADFLDEEDQALEQVAADFEALKLDGLLLYAAGRPAGFSIYSPLNSDTADIHFEKADHTVKGAPQKLTALVAAQLKESGFAYMNREQDMGEPGLRQAKRSLDPCRMVRRLELTLL